MRVFLTGATGFIGRKVALRLARDGHEVVAWVRDETRAAQLLGDEPELLPTACNDEALHDALARCQAVVNLAGSPVSRRWTPAVLRELEASRVELTHRLVDGIEATSTRPAVLVSASAVGWYGHRGDAVVDEDAAPGKSTLGDLCERWEEQARRAEPLGLRVALMRIGLVLGRDGGALQAAVPAFRLGLGAAVGSGEQMMPWIHVADAVEMIVAAVGDAAYRGPVNVTAPAPCSNRAFTSALGRALRRPTLLRVPGWLLRLTLGAASEILLTGADVRPRAALRNGFEFAFADLDAALCDLLNPRDDVAIQAAADPPARAYLRLRPARYVLRTSMRVGASLRDVFAFFERAENLGALTPPDMSFQIMSPRPIHMAAATRIRYRIKLGPVQLPWVTEIDVWDPPAAFSDSQLRGPYASWYHEHLFAPDEAGGTVVTDRVWYAPPLGWLGAVANRLFVAPAIRRIFEHRADAMHWRFGPPEGVATETSRQVTRAAS